MTGVFEWFHSYRCPQIQWGTVIYSMSCTNKVTVIIQCVSMLPGCRTAGPVETNMAPFPKDKISFCTTNSICKETKACICSVFFFYQFKLLPQVTLLVCLHWMLYKCLRTVWIQISGYITVGNKNTDCSVLQSQQVHETKHTHTHTNILYMYITAVESGKKYIYSSTVLKYNFKCALNEYFHLMPHYASAPQLFRGKKCRGDRIFL